MAPACPATTWPTALERALRCPYDIDAIFDDGLHEFIQNFLRAIARRSAPQIEIDYRFYLR